MNANVTFPSSNMGPLYSSSITERSTNINNGNVRAHTCQHLFVSTYLTAVTHVLQVDGVCYTPFCVIYPYRSLKCHLLHDLAAFRIFNFGICIIWFCFGHLQQTCTADTKSVFQCTAMVSTSIYYSIIALEGGRKLRFGQVSWSPN